MKHTKDVDTLLFLLLFTKSQREKDIEKIAQKREEQRLLGILYHNIYQIQKINFLVKCIFT